MWMKRLAYALVTVAAIAAFIVTDSGIALFLCVCLGAVPLISFFMLVFAARRLKFDFEIREACIRGGALQLTVRARLTPRFLAGSVKAVAEFENTTFRKIERKTFVIKDLSFSPYVYEFVSADSGRINVRFPQIVLVDLFGICSFRVTCAKYAEAMVSPVLYEDLRIRLGVNTHSAYTGEQSVPQKGGDHTEIFNIRDYVAGDSLHSVHWKLSGKYDELKCKEYGATNDNRLLLLADLSRRKGETTASDARLNAVLDVVSSVSESLASRGIAHCAGWFNGGEFHVREVHDNESYVSMVYALMSIKADDGNAESLFYLSRVPEKSSFTKIIFVAPSVTAEDIKAVSEADVTAVIVCESEGELNEGGVKMIRIPYDSIEKSLASRVL